MCPHDLKIGRTKAYVGVSLASVFCFWRNLPDSHFPYVLDSSSVDSPSVLHPLLPYDFYSPGTAPQVLT